MNQRLLAKLHCSLSFVWCSTS